MEILSDGPSQDLVDHHKRALRKAINNKKDAVGLAILVKIKDKYGGPAGVDTDILNMGKVLRDHLNFVIYDVSAQGNPIIKDIKAIISAASTYKYPSSLKFVCFYYAGHGGSNDGHPYIMDEDRKQLRVTDDIISPFYPENAEHLDKCIRLFFFDCCLTDEGARDHGQYDKKPLIIPPRGNCLVAYSTSLTTASRGDDENGGFWTKHLSQNLQKLDAPLSTILDVTYKETVEFCSTKYQQQDLVQGPHYVSCVGPVCLRDPNKSLEEIRTIFQGGGIEDADIEDTDEPKPKRAKKESCNGNQVSSAKLKYKDGTPKLVEVLPFFKKCLAQWQDIGTHMKLEPHHINEIEIDQQQVKDKMRSMLIKCEKVLGDNYTWTVLIRALRNVDENTIANNIENYLEKEYPVNCN